MGRKPLSTVPAEVTLTLRMTDHDRALLDRLVAHRAEELREIGATEVDVTAANYLRGLIRREAKAKGITVPMQEKPAAPVAPPPPATDSLAAKAHSALMSAIGDGEVQAEIARRAGIDPGALSRFAKTRKGLSPAKLESLAKAAK